MMETLTHLSKGDEESLDGEGLLGGQVWGYKGSQDEGTLQE